MVFYCTHCITTARLDHVSRVLMHLLGLLQAGCEMLRGLPDHDAPKDLTTVAAHAESIITRVLRAQCAAVSVLDMQTKSMSSITIPPWLGVRDQHAIKLSNAAYSVVSQATWHAVRFFSFSFSSSSFFRQIFGQLARITGKTY